MDQQHTLKFSGSFSGIALHTGARATLRFLPAEANHGIVFRRIDQPGQPEVAAVAEHVVDTRRGTTIGNEHTVIHTIEHIMASLHALQIDNAIVEMDGPEPPIADGSALGFFTALKKAGLVEQDAPARYLDATRIFHVNGGATQLVLAPDDHLSICCTTSFRGCPVDPQFLDLAITPESFEAELAGARTFVSYSDLGQLIAMGLVKGGSLDAAAIIHNGAIICKDKLRYPNEIVRHKMLDLVGDLFLCGARVRGRVIAVKPGHQRNDELALQLRQALQHQEI